MSRRANPTRFVVGCALLLVPGALHAQRAESGHASRVDGVVRDSSGARIRDATLADLGDGRPLAISDDSGGFHISGLAAGRSTLLVRRLGFAPDTIDVIVFDARPTHLDVVMTAAAVQLAGEAVRADSARSFKMSAFNTRRARGIGFFLTRQDIVKRHAGTVSDLLRFVPGVTVEQRMAGEPQPVRMQRSANPTNEATCTVILYVDGNPYPNGSVDDFPPGSLEGIEVYRSASEIPAEFRNRDSMCGLISLWTRDPEAARRP